MEQHHERWDGRGYPNGLSGENIDPLARILSIADAFDAMTSSRSYRKGMPLNVAFERLIKGAGTQLDPNMILVLINNYMAITREAGVDENKRAIVQIISEKFNQLLSGKELIKHDSAAKLFEEIRAQFSLTKDDALFEESLLKKLFKLKEAQREPSLEKEV